MRPGPSPEVRAATHLVQILSLRAAQRPEFVGTTYLSSRGPQTLTYREIFDQSARTATRLALHARPGDRVVLLFGSGLDFIHAFLGCHIAGLVPVPVMPPRDLTPGELSRVQSILEDAEPAAVVTIPQLAQMGPSAFPGMQWLTLESLDEIEPMAPVPCDQAAELALIQYTSGSTSAPRGVMVSHANLLHNLGYIYRGERNDAQTVSVSWLPMSHDMGLVEGILQPLYGGHPVVLMSPRAFLKRPLRWLEAISTYGATVSGGPNFAYDLVLRKLGDGPLPELDLSSWSFAYNGSEPVRPETIEAFCRRLEPVGFRRSSMQPLYGMAEATLGITEGRFGQEPRFQKRISAGRERTLVSCGTTPDDLALVIVDGDGRRAGPGEEGEIWLAGPCIAEGYWRRPEQTAQTFGAQLVGDSRRYLRTGDLGFVLDKEVFISGRSKELIISRGQNVHPADLEHTAEAAHPWLRPGASAAFRIDGEQESAGLVAEVRREAVAATPDARSAVAREVRRAVVRAHAIDVSFVALVAPGTIPRTTSGKRQRSRVGALWARGELPTLATASSEAGASGLAERVANLLGVEVGSLDVELTLPELGLDSVRALELYAEVASRYALAALLGSSLQSLLEQGEPEPIRDKLSERFAVAEATGSDRVLLTGATGFLGGQVLVQLLSTEEVEVVCLVRGAGGRERLRAGLPRWEAAWETRITVIEGDVAKVRLGLTEAQYVALTQSIGTVYHGAAMVNWAYPYAALAPTNVGGTVEVLELAALAGARVVYISSMAVCWSLTAGEVDEQTDPTDHLDGIHLAYVRSKAVAEGLVREAGARGLSISIVRPGLVFSHSETGRHSPGDFLSALCKGCIEMGAAPDLDWHLDVIPVDEAARAVVGVPAGRCLNVEAPIRRTWRSVVLWMNLRGHRMGLLPYDAWCVELQAHTEVPGATLRPLRSFFLRPVLGDLRLPQLYEEARRNPISSEASADVLERGVALDAALLERTFTYLSAVGYLPAAAWVDDRPERERRGRLGPRAPGRYLSRGHLEVIAGASSQSILGELASWRFGCAAGVRRVRLRLDREGGDEEVAAVLKSTVSDRAILDIGGVLAGLCSEALGQAWAAHRDQSEILRGAEREAAIYRSDDTRFTAHLPRLLGGGAGHLLLEDLTGLALLDAVDAWDEQATCAAVRGIGELHAAWLGRPFEAEWLPPSKDPTSLRSQRPLWHALADHALRHDFGVWLGSAGRTRYSELRDEPAAWATVAAALPKTLIHNDFSPRNAALRDDGRLVVYDWELATLGLPQRDLAEFLCFTLPVDVEAPLLAAMLELHRSTLEAATGLSLDRADWRAGFSAALADLMVTRLPMYAMIDPFRPQRFLERVVRTWCALDRLTGHP